MLARVLYLILGFVLAIGALLGLIGFLHLSRSHPVRRLRIVPDGSRHPAASDPEFIRHIETHVNTRIEAGARVELLFDGQLFDSLRSDLRAASELITWHVFWMRPGRIAEEMHSILCDRASAGVEVLFLYDQFGAWGMKREYFRTLERAGCEVHCYRPLCWHTLHKWAQRSHTRTVVIDGRVGYTGGFGIDDHWIAGGRTADRWRDTNVRVYGPAVYRLQAVFAADWAETTGDLVLGDRMFPLDVRDEHGPHRAGLLHGAPSLGSTEVERFFALSIQGARESLFICSAYFVPDDGFCRLLCEAAARGVDVRILTAGSDTDRTSALHGGRARYERLLEGGVRVYEYGPTMMHAKTLVADRIWCAIGTMNFDNRSMALNDEVGLLVHDAGIGATLHDRFLEDLGLSREFDLESFRRRGPVQRLKERFYSPFWRFL